MTRRVYYFEQDWGFSTDLGMLEGLAELRCCGEASGTWHPRGRACNAPMHVQHQVAHCAETGPRRGWLAQIIQQRRCTMDSSGDSCGMG